MLANKLAAVHIELGDLDQARHLLHDALRADPTNGLAWTNLAHVYLRSMDPQSALIAAERGVHARAKPHWQARLGKPCPARRPGVDR